MAGNEISPKQLNGIATLLQTGNVAQSAKIVGVSERQFWRWMDDPNFQAELQRKQNELVDGAYMRLQSVLSGAVDVIAAIAFDTSIAPAVRLRAADSVVSHTLRWRESVDLAARLDELEAAIAQDMLMAAVTENSDPVQPARRVIDYRLKLKPPPGYTDGDDQSAP